MWTQSAASYVKEAVKNMEEWMERMGLKFPAQCDTPMPTTYRPELDVSPELLPEVANWYQSAIGVLWWAIELGRVDITTKTLMMASMMAFLRNGYLVAILRIFTYLKKHHNSCIVFNPTYPDIDYSSFGKKDWTRFYNNVKEPIPPNAPKPLGLPVVICFFVDADHAVDHLTRRSRTGYVMYLNSAIVNWYSKKQGSVEGATFGSEFMAIKTVVKMNRGLRYKL